MNKDWHREHPMPVKPTLEQRIEWHRQHSRHCACREVPKDLRRYVEERDRDQARALPADVTSER